jgi:hypothetical protein
VPSIVGASIVVIALVLFLPRNSTRQVPESAPAPAGSTTTSADDSASPAAVMRERRDASRLLHSRGGGSSSQSPEVVVARKASDFARGRREIAQAMATHFGVQVPPDVERFFDAAEGGAWDDIKRLFNDLSAAKEAGGGARDLDVLWPAVKDAYSVAVLAKSWPAHEVLDYGRSILSSLQPGMVYVAGSDASRYAPMLIGETSGGEPPVILPQNGLAEGNQIDYLGFLHGDRFSHLSREDAKGAFDRFAQEAQEQSGGNPAGTPPPIRNLDEILLRVLMEKNPGTSFAVEAATPMPGLFAEAAPQGPILEVRAGGVSEAETAARARQSVNYWRQTAERLQADNSLSPDSPSRSAYAQMAAAQANFFAARNLMSEAEEAYRLGRDIAPASVDALGQLTGFLAKTGRQGEALRLLDAFSQQFEEHQAAAEQLKRSLAPPRDGGE